MTYEMSGGCQPVTERWISSAITEKPTEEMFAVVVSGVVSPELIGQYAEICAVYARSVDLFTQLQTYKHMSVSSIPDVLVATEPQLLTHIKSLQQAHTRRLDSYTAKIRVHAQRIEGVSKIKCQKEQANKDQKIRTLIMGGKLKAPSPAEDWERDTNFSQSTHHAEIESELELAKRTIVEYHQLIDCVVIFSRGLELAVEEMVAREKMDITEEGEWIRGTLYSEEIFINRPPLEVMLENTLRWLHSPHVKEILRKQELIRETFRKVQKKKIEKEIFENTPWFDAYDQLLCRHCLHSGEKYHLSEQCLVLHPELGPQKAPQWFMGIPYYPNTGS